MVLYFHLYFVVTHSIVKPTTANKHQMKYKLLGITHRISVQY